jgi:hypothetical protein
MPVMSETFVDLSYRGLALGKRVKLTQVRPTTGYLEMPTPMPVGTRIAISTDDGVQMDALVTEIHEQVGGSDVPPGMRVQPTLEAAADAWWKARQSAASAPAPAPAPAPSAPASVAAVAAPITDGSSKVTVVSPRTTPALADDGRSTQVMEAIKDERAADADGEGVDTVIADLPGDTNPTLPIVDDGKRTMAMDAVDLAALGLASVSQQMAAVKPEDYADGDDNGGDAGSSGPIPTGGKKKKSSRKRRG